MKDVYDLQQEEMILEEYYSASKLNSEDMRVYVEDQSMYWDTMKKSIFFFEV